MNYKSDCLELVFCCIAAWIQPDISMVVNKIFLLSEDDKFQTF